MNENIRSEWTLVRVVVACLFILLSVLPVTAAENTAAEKGVVVIIAVHPASAQGDMNFYSGDTINLTGTNTESRTTYLFITGPNLNENGSQIQSTHPADSPVIDGDASSFIAVAVGPDNHWSYAWDTRDSGLAPGAYTIYAVGKPHNKNGLAETAYGTTSVVIAKPASQAATATEVSRLEELITMSSGGAITAGTPVTVKSVINISAGTEGSLTFPSNHDLLFRTTLENPKWNYSIVLDNIENVRYPDSGKVLDLSGFELSYNSNVKEAVVVTVQGTAPSVSTAATKPVIEIFVVDNYGNTVPDTTVVRNAMVLPAVGTRQ